MIITIIFYFPYEKLGNDSKGTRMQTRKNNLINRDNNSTQGKPAEASRIKEIEENWERVRLGTKDFPVYTLIPGSKSHLSSFPSLPFPFFYSYLVSFLLILLAYFVTDIIPSNILDPKLTVCDCMIIEDEASCTDDSACINR